jgi:hypothetical protein
MSLPPIRAATFPPAIPFWRPHRLTLAAAATVAILALAIWQIPPRLDWSRYRGAIASYASNRLGRPVTIGGPVSLSLLPRATLIASAVTLADRGDGISARLGAMRLEISLASLLSGHVVPSTLMLDDPVATLPWPIPRAAPGLRPAIAREFLAGMNGGVLTIGGVAFRDIAATFQTDPDTGAFDAYGSAMIDGLPWHFTALVGAPGADGVSPLTITLDGQPLYAGAHSPGRKPPDMRGTGGAFHGRILSDGTVTGTLALRGPDLSRLGPAPRLPWQVLGDVHGDSAAIGAPSLRLTLGSATGHANAALHLAAPVSLTLAAAFGQVPLGDWAFSLLQAGSNWPTRLPATLDLGAETALLSGATIQAPHALLALNDGRASVRDASAILPGAAHLDLSGAFTQADGFAGRAHLTAPDFRRTLAWITSGRSAGLPPTVLNRADLSGAVTLAGPRLTLDALTGHIDAAVVTGSAAIGLTQRPSLGLDLAVDRLALAEWLGWVRAPVQARGLGAMAAPFAALDTALRLRADDASLPGLPIRHALLDLHGDEAGLTLHQLALSMAGGTLQAAGTIGPDGTLAAAHAEFATEDAASLPAAWRLPATLWHGPFHVAVSASGAPADLASQWRADLGDLRAEAEAHVDALAPRLTATITLRHPGAPRLLEEAGLPGTASWLENGSLAVLAHLSAWPGHIQARDFSIAAGALRAEGALDADLSAPEPSVTGHIDADMLALPGLALDDPAAWHWTIWQGWQGDVGVSARTVSSGLRPVAEGLAARLILASGAASIQDISASVSGGRLSARVALDTTQHPPVLAAQADLEQARLGPWPSAAPFGLQGGSLDAAGDVLARGDGGAALLAGAEGSVSGKVADATLGGIDLTALTAALHARGPHLAAQLAAALGGGTSPGLEGEFSARIADGTVTLGQARLEGAAGAVDLSGSVRGRDGAAALFATAWPAVPSPPGLRRDLAAGVKGADVKPGLIWAGQGQTHRPRRKK